MASTQQDSLLMTGQDEALTQSSPKESSPKSGTNKKEQNAIREQQRQYYFGAESS